jgi:hypothetical protein
MKVFEMYTGNGEGNNITLYFDNKKDAIESAKRQVIDDTATVVSFKIIGSIVDVLNQTHKQQNRRVVYELRRSN